MQLFFNSSMPRSGSELLQVLLHQNPDIYGSPTSPLLEYQFAARNNFELPEVQSQPLKLMTDAFLSMNHSMADGYYSTITRRPFVIDKNRGWLHYYEWVEQWCPQPKMVCIVRDLRSILASMERAYRSNRHRPIGPDNPAELANMTVTARVNYWLNTQPVGMALQRLVDVLQKGLGDKVLFLRYEDLTQSPQQTLERWYQFVGLPPIKHTFDNISKSVIEDSRVYGPYFDHQIKPTLTAARDWQDTIPDLVGQMIVQANRWYFNHFSYPTSQTQTTS